MYTGTLFKRDTCAGEPKGDSGTGGYFDDGAPQDASSRLTSAFTDKAYGARGAVQRIHEEMTDIETALCQIEAENEEMKTRLLNARQSVWAKYFMWDDTLTQQGVIGYWRHWVIVKKQQREVDGINGRHTRSIKELKQRQEDLEEECAQLRFAAEQLQEVTSRELATLNGERDDALCRVQQLEAIISQMGEVAGRVTGLSEQAMQRPVASPGILADIDRTELDKLVKSTLQDILTEAEQAKAVPTVAAYPAYPPQYVSQATTILGPPTASPTFIASAPAIDATLSGALQRCSSPSFARNSSSQNISFPGPVVGGGGMKLQQAPMQVGLVPLTPVIPSVARQVTPGRGVPASSSSRSTGVVFRSSSKGPM